VEGSAAVLDPTSIADLRQLGPAILVEMIHLYMEDTPPRLGDLAAAAAAGAAEQVADLAHAIKGSSANFGAATLVDLCRDLEQRARAGDLAGWSAAVVAINAEYGRVCAALELERRR
jgi:HPt (histidine-containing phosphotransfer) domain-containing protein